MSEVESVQQRQCNDNIGKPQMYSDEEIINQIYMLGQVIGRTPTTDTFQACPYTCAIRTVSNRFGCWNNAVKEAGLKPHPSKNHK